MKNISITLLGFGIAFAIIGLSELFCGMPEDTFYLALGCTFAGGMLYMISADAN